MKNRLIILVLIILSILTGCNRTPQTGFDWDNQGKIEYIVDYSVSFSGDHDSTMQLSATSNYGAAKIVSVPSGNLLDADDRPVRNTFIILEDTVPIGKSITLHRGDLSYTGGKPEFIHFQVVGSDDLVELRILGTDTLAQLHTNTISTILYSIRDSMFYDPYDAQSIAIPGGHRFSAILPVMTEEQYPKTSENHSIKIEFLITANDAK
ncbi:MAG: hypothetical protein IJK07_03765 [Bacteroidales bacterium]|nr:hypothetical protein [Bacteroidales bacterium]